ncbi:glycosyl hydrolase family 28-related protein [Streptomyces sp. NBRC 109706]|uniref:glycosyl hydrolase family 28-related protein n=1 Tax=Streptomyces sp. NBRC 109706 TaxID=1550035 RepID=UPI00099D90A5
MDFLRQSLLVSAATAIPPTPKDPTAVTSTSERPVSPSPTSRRRPRVGGLSGALSLLLVAAGAAVATVGSAPGATAAAVPAVSPLDVEGRGATVPFVEQEAENADYDGELIGPDRIYGTLPSEASGRQAVTLDAVGEYVEFTLTEPANAMTFRYSLPDSPEGTGRDAEIDLLLNGEAAQSLPVTSKYGWYYGGYPFNNNPSDTNPHHFYDETRTLFGETLPAGSTVRLQVSSVADSPSFTIDLADFEVVAAPIARPSGAIDVVADFGADPTGAEDATALIQAAVDAGAAEGREVYLPEGTFQVRDHIIVDRVTLRGAGPWYSVLTGRDPVDRTKAVGVYGKYAHEGGSSDVTLRDFAIIGDIQERVDEDQVNAIGGAMSDSVVDNVWLQHTKCGAWMTGPMDNFEIRNSRILDQTADGVNFHMGVTNSTVTNTFVRNTGDDALAMWAENIPNENNAFTHNTVILPILANHIVTYGGRDITLSDNVLAESITNGGGLHIANRYPGVNSGNGTAVDGHITAERNTLIRTGNNDYNWQFGVGAIWFAGLNEPIEGADILIADTEVLDSSYAAIHLIEGASRGITFDNVTIDRTGTYALQIQSPGSMTFNNVVATGIAQENPIHNCVGAGFEIIQGEGNSGWFADPPECTGVWPDPVW